MSHIPHVEDAPARPSAAPGPLVPSRWRQAAFVLAGVYPVITLLLYAVLPFTAAWPIWQTTLVVAPLMVSVMVFGLLPLIQRRFSRFIMVPARK